MKNTGRSVLLISIILTICMMMFSGCGSGGGGNGDSTASKPTVSGTGDSTPSKPTVSGTVVDVDTWPNIPIPTSLDNIPSRTETVTYISPLITDWKPTVTAAKADWSVEYHFCSGTCGSPHHENESDFWSDEPPVSTYCGRTVTVTPWPITFMEDGVILDPPSPNTKEEVMKAACYHNDATVREWRQWKGSNLKPLTNVPYLRRDRYCVIEGNPEKIDGPRTRTVSLTHTKGVETTKATEFATSLSVTGEISNAFASMSATIEASFLRNYSKTITEVTTEEVSDTYNIPANETWLFLSWTCIDKYSISDSDGNPYTDPNYKFDENINSSVEVSGTKTEEKIHQFQK